MFNHAQRANLHIFKNMSRAYRICNLVENISRLMFVDLKLVNGIYTIQIKLGLGPATTIQSSSISFSLNLSLLLSRWHRIS